LEWLQELGKINADNPKTVGRETRDSRNFWDKKMEHVKIKIKEFEAYIQNRNIIGSFRGINEFKKGYQPRTNLVKNENIAHLLIPTVF
jgi:hypothetical protein